MFNSITLPIYFIVIAGIFETMLGRLILPFQACLFRFERSACNVCVVNDWRWRASEILPWERVLAQHFSTFLSDKRTKVSYVNVDGTADISWALSINIIFLTSLQTCNFHLAFLLFLMCVHAFDLFPVLAPMLRVSAVNKIVCVVWIVCWKLSICKACW